MIYLTKNLGTKAVLAVLGIVLAGLLLMATTFGERGFSGPLSVASLSGGNPFGDAIPVPGDVQLAELEIAATQSALGAEPGWDRTSDFMIGTVAVAVILPNCNGSIQTCTQGGWSSGDVDQVLEEVQNALVWWQQKANEASVGEHLTFHLVTNPPLIVPTGYEPIEKPGGGAALCGEEGLWVDDVMANLGYNDYSGGNTYLSEVRQYNNDLREQHNTDWAFTIFVADASHDPDGMFGETTCGGTVDEFAVPAWAYLAGPFLAANTINNGYGFEFIDGVIAHEIGHIFGAPDEVPSGTCTAPPNAPTCSTPFGYLGFENQNCGAREVSFSCTIDVDNSMMVVAEDFGSGIIQNVIHEYTVGHIGWHDSDIDDIPDTVDTFPFHTLTSPVNPNIDRAFSGTSQDVPFPTTLPFSEPWRPAYTDVTINKIVAVEYRVNSGAWSSAAAQDGAFDSAMEDYFFEPLICKSGVYTVDVRVINSVGNVSNIETDIINVSTPENCTYVYLPVVLSPESSPPPLSLPSGYPGPSESSLVAPTESLILPQLEPQKLNGYP